MGSSGKNPFVSEQPKQATPDAPRTAPAAPMGVPRPAGLPAPGFSGSSGGYGPTGTLTGAPNRAPSTAAGVFGGGSIPMARNDLASAMSRVAPRGPQYPQQGTIAPGAPLTMGGLFGGGGSPATPATNPSGSSGAPAPAAAAAAAAPRPATPAPAVAAPAVAAPAPAPAHAVGSTTIPATGTVAPKPFVSSPSTSAEALALMGTPAKATYTKLAPSKAIKDANAAAAAKEKKSKQFTIDPKMNKTKSTDPWTNAQKAKGGRWEVPKGMPKGTTAMWVNAPVVAPVAQQPIVQTGQTNTLIPHNSNGVGNQGDSQNATTSGNNWGGNSSANSGYGPGGRHW